MLTRIDHVGIACRDLDAKIAFYESAFGLTVASIEVNEAQGVR
ncbi:MAG TPA: VOC family protein, partial [Streptosporangiaceae bacterium]|nr:VOC family protein [Streptosporangiaceae bacterium]